MVLLVEWRWIVVLVCLAAAAGGAWLVWRRFRLRRALFALRNQIMWSLRHAPRDKLVLEVGSGHNPHLRSDVLCEKYLYDVSSQ